MQTEMTVDKLQDIIHEACVEARKAAEKFFNDKLDSVDQGACGFSWVNIYEFNGERIKGNTKLGRMMKKVGVDQNYARAFEIWNPSRFPCQNVDTHEHGAKAAAEVFRKYGFTAYAGSRLD